MRIYDRVYGQVELSPLLKEILHSPEMQRLDDIRQLGGCCFVFPSATHTRLEHSIGTCHLAGLAGRKFLTSTDIDMDDILCLEIAGLVHDVGHGPFSHTFEHFLTKEKISYSHENTSLL